MATTSRHIMENRPFRVKSAPQENSSLSQSNTIRESTVLYSTVAETKRRLSPPSLPPRWGQDVAPPPTPFYTPQTSPGGGSNGIRTVGNTLQGGDEVEVLNVGTYNPSECSDIMEPERVEPMIQLREYRTRYQLQPHSRNRKLVKHRRLNNHGQSQHLRPTGSMVSVRDQQHLRNTPYSCDILNTRNNPMVSEQNDDEDLMVRSDDVITYSYRFGKSGSINRYPIDQFQQPLHLSGSRISLPNEVVRSKPRHRNKHRQNIHNNVSPEELATVDEVPVLTNYVDEDHFRQEQQRVGGLETQGRGYFVGDTKIYDNNWITLNTASHGYRYNHNIDGIPTYNYNPTPFTSLKRTYKPINPPPNSQSSSPICTGSSGTSPEAPNQPQSSQPHPSSPASPESNINSQSTIMIVNHCRVDRRDPYFHQTAELENHFSGPLGNFGPSGMSINSSTSSLTQTTIQRRSAMKMPSSSGESNVVKYPRKSVQWLIDTKKRPEDISRDRKVVKHQVG